MDELALAAASALMTAVATDAWSEVRAGVISLWRRVYPERVSAIESELVDARSELVVSRQACDTEVENELAADWRRKFQRLTRAHPELRMLEGEWTRLAPAADRDRLGVTNIEQTPRTGHTGAAVISTTRRPAIADGTKSPQPLLHEHRRQRSRSTAAVSVAVRATSAQVPWLEGL